MNGCILFIVFNAIFVIHIQADTKCNLKAIFKTPRRNFDEFEIIERSNFLSEEPDSNSPQKLTRSDPGTPNTYSNARVLLRLGDYRNAIKKNNNNVNTRITLAAPNHNNYYHSQLHPYYSQVVPQNGGPWSMYAPPRTPQYLVVNRPNYLPQYQILPQNIPILNQVNTMAQPQFIQKPKIFINDPILLDASSIQHIPIPPPLDKKRSTSNGLNSMTFIPKILIDTVAKKPSILEELETQKPLTEPKPENETKTAEKEPAESVKLEIGETPKAPEAESLQISEILPSGKLEDTPNEPEESELLRVSPVVFEETPKEEETPEPLQIVEIVPTVVEETITDASVKNQEIQEVAQPNTEEKKEDQMVIKGNIEPIDSDFKPIVEIEETPSEPTSIHNMDHPRVLHPVQLSSNIENVEIIGAGNVNISLDDAAPPTIQNCSNSQDFELVDLLQKSLVPLINLKSNEAPKLLVSYPVINSMDKEIPAHPTAIYVQTLNPEPTFCPTCASCVNRRGPKVDIDDLVRSNLFTPNMESSGYQFSSSMSSQSVPSINGGQNIVSGYQISTGSGYYEDPTKKIIYNKPTEIKVVPPQVSNVLPNFLYPQYAPLERVQPDFLNTPSPRSFAPLPSSSRSLLELLHTILTGGSSNAITPARTHICPYCSNVIRLPTIVRCPHCQRHHNVNIQHSAPGNNLYNANIGQNMETSWNPMVLPPRCPYCAKYKGELNQFE